MTPFLRCTYELPFSNIGAVIIKSAYGEKVYEGHGKELARLNRLRSEMITRVYPRLWAVDIFPICRFYTIELLLARSKPLYSVRYIPSWFPGATFRRIGEEGTAYSRKVRFMPFKLVEKAVVCTHPQLHLMFLIYSAKG